MKEHMLPALRTEVGLGSPPEPYYQNKSESMNEVLKDQVKYQESELPEFIQKVSGIGERHKDLLRKAVARTGEWELLPGFRFLERPNWFKMTSQQREAHMKVVMKIELSEDRSLATLILPQASSTQPLLSAGYDQIPNISSFTLKKMWKEARELVGSPGYIMPVAGSSCPFAKQVFNSKQPSKPLVVTRRPTKQSATGYVFECDPMCPQYSYLGLCCHTVAPAESSRVLKEYLDFLEKNTAPPNLHQLSLIVSGRKGAGRKGSKPVRCRARAYEKQPVLDTAFSRTANNSSHSPIVEQRVREITANADSEDMASDSQKKHILFPVHTTISAENQQETKIPSSYSGFRIGSLFFSENQQDQQEAISSQLSCSRFHIQGTSLSREQQQQHQSSASSQAFSCVPAGTTHWEPPAGAPATLYLVTTCLQSCSCWYYTHCQSTTAEISTIYLVTTSIRWVLYWCYTLCLWAATTAIIYLVTDCVWWFSSSRFTIGQSTASWSATIYYITARVGLFSF